MCISLHAIYGISISYCTIVTVTTLEKGGRTGLMVRASDSGSGDPGSILGRVGVFVSLSKRHLLPKKVLVIPRNRWLRLNLTEKLFTGTLNHNQNKNKKTLENVRKFNSNFQSKLGLNN